MFQVCYRSLYFWLVDLGDLTASLSQVLLACLHPHGHFHFHSIQFSLSYRLSLSPGSIPRDYGLQTKFLAGLRWPSPRPCTYTREL